MSKRKYNWPCRVILNTNDESGKKISVDRTVEGYGVDHSEIVYDVYKSSKQPKHLLHGVEWIVITPIGQRSSHDVCPDCEHVDCDFDHRKYGRR